MTDRPSQAAHGQVFNKMDPDLLNLQTASASSDDTSSFSNVNSSLSGKQHDRNMAPSAPHGTRASVFARGQPLSAGTSSSPHSLNVSRTASTAASPHSSRDSSPAGPPFRNASSNNSTTSLSRQARSRKNSQEVSPQRHTSMTSSTTPSATAIQRALNGAATPQLYPTSTEPNSRIPRSQKSNGNLNGSERPTWPTPPRLKSPPPSASSRRSLSSQRRIAENSLNAPNIVVQRAAQDSPTLQESSNGQQESTVQRSSAPRATSSKQPQSTLETVQESASVPPTPSDPPAPSSNSSDERKHEYFSFISDEDRPQTALLHSNSSDGSLNETSSTPRASGSARKRSSVDGSDIDATPKAKTSASAAQIKSQPKSDSDPNNLRNMTVETETVSSIPQGSLAPPSDRVLSGRAEGSGTIRVKASTETIRPKKERKKAAKKAPSVTASTTSTRADIFEDRVKNAMDEATSDDSDETFVYESNPPEQQPRRSRNHSRTPSGASLASMAERVGLRSVSKVLDPHRTVAKTRSMKFASGASNYGTADEDPDTGSGTIRLSNRNGNSMVHHHIRGQRNVTSQPLQPEDDGNIVPLSKTKSLTAVGGRGSYAARLAAQQLRHNGSIKRDGGGYASLDLEAEGADDERTPLMGSVRTPRSTRTGARRYRYADFRPSVQQRRQNMLARFAGCLLILTTVGLLAFGVVCFLFAMSKPLNEVAIVELSNVIASEQYLMMDVVVQALNPNLVPITITDLDVNLFARSKFVGSQKWWRDHGRDSSVFDEDNLPKEQTKTTNGENLTINGKNDITITDPQPKPEPTGQTMLLGHVLQFDNPLNFDGSFWRRQKILSTGSIRLSKPGNHTEAGGSERWERVLKHDFELILRGVVRYSIPLGGKTISVPVNGETEVEGNGSKDGDDKKKGEDPHLGWPFDPPT